MNVSRLVYAKIMNTASTKRKVMNATPVLQVRRNLTELYHKDICGNSCTTHLIAINYM